ncbi:fatty acid CoA ligase FadD9 [Mycolicibacterium rutilum]|uniref:Carboxylic acid reductase n=1 Tax=Mycolicibacterium rutilum TaxID=370526 RepID=A0A1H6J6E6_MYCRU|nr:fatty acid CoA ligase FadD9 [Mycolicibacterium rutilum]
MLAAAALPGLRLAEILDTLMRGYSERPLLGFRSRTDHPTSQITAGGAHFDTVTRQQFWVHVQAVSAALSIAVAEPVAPGEFMAIIGFSSPDYLTLDMACAYLGLVSVPLQHNAPATTLAPIIAETAPTVLAASADYLDLALHVASGHDALRHLVVFDYQPGLPRHRQALEQARRQLSPRGVHVHTLDTLLADGATHTPPPLYTDGTPDRLAMILYTSGSTGTPKGAMFTEDMLCRIWSSRGFAITDDPVINLNFMPLNHLGGRMPILSAIQSGGTSYFVAEPDLSTLFDDLAQVRPTELALVPRIVDMLYQHYLTTVDRLRADGLDAGAAHAAATVDLRDTVLGGRVVSGFIATAPLAPEMRDFLHDTLDVHIVDSYGLTEAGPVARDGHLVRPPIVDYKLVDVPELGYYTTDQPHPRGELLIKSTILFPGYYQRPDVTATVFDADGFYRTGDVMAEIAPDHLVYLDRRNNVLKLSQGEFVAIAHLEAVYSAAPGVRQIFVYGNSERPNLLAVVVPTDEALQRYGNGETLRTQLHRALQDTAKATQLQSYEIPTDFLIETTPFTAANGLLSGVGKLLRPNLKAHYAARLETLYTDHAAAQAEHLQSLRQGVHDRPVIDTLLAAVRIILGVPDPTPDAHFTDLGGDSLSALTLSTLLTDLFGTDISVGTIINPATNLATLAQHLDQLRTSTATRPTAATVIGADTAALHAADLTLEKFIDRTTLDAAADLPRAADQPHTVLITGANGWLGRFLTLDWLERLAERGGTLIALVRGRDHEHARARLTQVYATDPELQDRFTALADGHLEVLAGDISEPNLGLDETTWNRLAHTVDRIVHPAALVNHVLPYRQLFEPNVLGTAELIRLALTHRIAAIDYLSTIAVAVTVAPERFLEDGDIRAVSPTRPLNDDYANGYANSKWAGEVLLREGHDLCGLPVAVFRSDLILAHSRYRGQLNLPDMFTRLLFSVLATHTAPHSFYLSDPDGSRARAHYDGLPVDFVADAITTLGATHTAGYTSFDVMNPHDDGVSLDVFVDWLIDAGHPIQRITDHTEWLHRFETALRQLPDAQRQQSVLPLLHAFAKPEPPLRGAAAPTGVFHTAVRAAHIGAEHDIPHITAALITKYIDDLRQLELLP